MAYDIAFAVEGRAADGTWTLMFDTTLLDGAWWHHHWEHNREGQQEAEALVGTLTGQQGLLLEALTGFTRAPTLFEPARNVRLRSLLAPDGVVDWGIVRNGPPTPGWPEDASAPARATHTGNAAGWWTWADALDWKDRCAAILEPRPLALRIWTSLFGDPEGARRAQAQAVLGFAQGLDVLVRALIGQGGTPWIGGFLCALPDKANTTKAHPFGPTAHAHMAARAAFHTAPPWSPGSVRVLMRAQ
jgi:hypothetical protein